MPKDSIEHNITVKARCGNCKEPLFSRIYKDTYYGGHILEVEPCDCIEKEKEK